MADVFISYPKADRPLALKLAAMLEAEGWKTWWDTSLIPGDDFRNEIMTELGRARAVIVIWTDASIKSDWVRSEAGRAQGDRKLIPVKLPNLSYKDLPPPFDVLHTEDIGEEDKIKAAVVAQLARPVVEPTAVALLTKGFRYELLTWVGIVGGAVSLFTNLGAVLKLADWARVLVEHWKEWTHAFWMWVFGWMGINLPQFWSAVLSFMVFWSFLTIGQAIRFGLIIHNPQTNYQERSFPPDDSWRIALCFALLITVPLFAMGFVNPLLTGLPTYIIWKGVIFRDLRGTALDLVAMIAAQIVMVLCARHRLYAVFSVLLISTFYLIITFSQITGLTMPISGFPYSGRLFFFMEMPVILAVILLLTAPAKAVTRRLIFLALGLLLLIALNELSKLGLDLTARKLQG